LRTKAKENPDGYIPISVLTTFNRLKQLTTDVAIIAEAVKNSDIVELSEDSTMLKRKWPLPEEDTSLPRSIYSKGWPEGTTIEKAAEFYAPHGKVLSVRLRKRPTGEFKGAIVVEFSSEEEAKAALAAAPQLEGHTLTYQSKEVWAQEKREAFQKKKAIQKEKKKEQKEKSEKKGKDKKRKEPDEEEEEEYTKGLILSYKGIGPQKREDLKPIFSEFGDVQFVDHTANAENGYIRFAAPEQASKAVESLTASKREFGGKVPTLAILEGEEEQKYWQALNEAKKGGRGGRGRGRGGRGGRGRGGGRGGKSKRQKKD